MQYHNIFCVETLYLLLVRMQQQILFCMEALYSVQHQDIPVYLILCWAFVPVTTGSESKVSFCYLKLKAIFTQPMKYRIMHELPWITIFGHEWGDLTMILTSDPVTSENHWQITSPVTKRSLLTATNVLFYFFHAILCPEHTILLKTIINRSFLHCHQGWCFWHHSPSVMLRESEVLALWRHIRWLFLHVYIGTKAIFTREQQLWISISHHPVFTAQHVRKQYYQKLAFLFLTQTSISQSCSRYYFETEKILFSGKPWNGPWKINIHICHISMYFCLVAAESF